MLAATINRPTHNFIAGHIGSFQPSAGESKFENLSIRPLTGQAKFMDA